MSGEENGEVRAETAAPAPQEEKAEAPKRGRGRPKGAKNKPPEERRVVLHPGQKGRPKGSRNKATLLREAKAAASAPAAPADEKKAPEPAGKAPESAKKAPGRKKTLQEEARGRIVSGEKMGIMNIRCELPVELL